MRRDIKINTETGDIKLADKNNSEFYPFEWTSKDETYLKGMVILPASFDDSLLYTNGVCVKIPYTPICKTCQISFVLDMGGHYKTIINKRNNAQYFVLNTIAATFPMISKYGYTLIISKDYDIEIYPAEKLDCVISVANIQNRNLLLKCVPSNNYRYPTSGVGLIRYLHASTSLQDLADKIKNEFNEDNVEVNYASFDTDTGELELDLDFTKTDENV